MKTIIKQQLSRLHILRLENKHQLEELAAKLEISDSARKKSLHIKNIQQNIDSRIIQLSALESRYDELTTSIKNLESDSHTREQRQTLENHQAMLKDLQNEIFEQSEVKQFQAIIINKLIKPHLQEHLMASLIADKDGYYPIEEKDIITVRQLKRILNLIQDIAILSTESNKYIPIDKLKSILRIHGDAKQLLESHNSKFLDLFISFLPNQTIERDQDSKPETWLHRIVSHLKTENINAAVNEIHQISLSITTENDTLAAEQESKSSGADDSELESDPLHKKVKPLFNKLKNRMEQMDQNPNVMISRLYAMSNLIGKIYAIDERDSLIVKGALLLKQFFEINANIYNIIVTNEETSLTQFLQENKQKLSEFLTRAHSNLKDLHLVLVQIEIDYGMKPGVLLDQLSTLNKVAQDLSEMLHLPFEKDFEQGFYLPVSQLIESNMRHLSQKQDKMAQKHIELVEWANILKSYTSDIPKALGNSNSKITLEKIVDGLSITAEEKIKFMNSINSVYSVDNADSQDASIFLTLVGYFHYKPSAHDVFRSIVEAMETAIKHDKALCNKKIMSYSGKRRCLRTHQVKYKINRSQAEANMASQNNLMNPNDQIVQAIDSSQHQESITGQDLITLYESHRQYLNTHQDQIASEKPSINLLEQVASIIDTVSTDKNDRKRLQHELFNCFNRSDVTRITFENPSLTETLSQWTNYYITKFNGQDSGLKLKQLSEKLDKRLTNRILYLKSKSPEHSPSSNATQARLDEVAADSPLNTVSSFRTHNTKTHHHVEHFRRIQALKHPLKMIRQEILNAALPHLTPKAGAQLNNLKLDTNYAQHNQVDYKSVQLIKHLFNILLVSESLLDEYYINPSANALTEESSSSYRKPLNKISELALDSSQGLSVTTKAKRLNEVVKMLTKNYTKIDIAATLKQIGIKETTINDIMSVLSKIKISSKKSQMSSEIFSMQVDEALNTINQINQHATCWSDKIASYLSPVFETISGGENLSKINNESLQDKHLYLDALDKLSEHFERERLTDTYTVEQYFMYKNLVAYAKSVLGNNQITSGINIASSVLTPSYKINHLKRQREEFQNSPVESELKEEKETFDVNSLFNLNPNKQIQERLQSLINITPNLYEQGYITAINHGIKFSTIAAPIEKVDIFLRTVPIPGLHSLDANDNKTTESVLDSLVLKETIASLEKEQNKLLRALDQTNPDDLIQIVEKYNPNQLSTDILEDGIQSAQQQIQQLTDALNQPTFQSLHIKYLIMISDQSKDVSQDKDYPQYRAEARKYRQNTRKIKQLINELIALTVLKDEPHLIYTAKRYIINNKKLDKLKSESLSINPTLSKSALEQVDRYNAQLKSAKLKLSDLRKQVKSDIRLKSQYESTSNHGIKKEDYDAAISRAQLLPSLQRFKSDMEARKEDFLAHLHQQNIRVTRSAAELEAKEIIRIDLKHANYILRQAKREAERLAAKNSTQRQQSWVALQRIIENEITVLTRLGNSTLSTHQIRELIGQESFRSHTALIAWKNDTAAHANLRPKLRSWNPKEILSFFAELFWFKFLRPSRPNAVSHFSLVSKHRNLFSRLFLKKQTTSESVVEQIDKNTAAKPRADVLDKPVTQPTPRNGR